MDAVLRMAHKYTDYIRDETLSRNIVASPELSPEPGVELESKVDGYQVTMGVKRVEV